MSLARGYLSADESWRLRPLLFQIQEDRAYLAKIAPWLRRMMLLARDSWEN